MLTKFEVTNFKNFENTFTFDFTDTKSYAFNSECVQDKVVSKALIYGQNGVGKSNLGFAMFDLISHLTSKISNAKNYQNYLNALSNNKLAEFVYVFKFGEQTLEYRYGKSNEKTLVYEKLSINGIEYIAIDRQINSIAAIGLEGTENLKKDLGDSQISLVAYVKNNAILATNAINSCFNQFVEFIDGMLFFRSLDKNSFIGFEEDSFKIEADIVNRGNLEDFQTFLNDAGVNCRLKAIENSGIINIAFDFGKKHIPFYDIASTGTRSLALFYAWLQRVKSSNASFVFIDEFDAFYHQSLSALIIEKLRTIQPQVVLTTHNTSLMTNDLLRPDCYFLMNNKEIKSLANRTRKELRFAHNIEKMYKAGTFGV
ncbi:MAG: ATP-binding protein [Psychrosphaera sp.]|nr:ATP-binding protein [Psychrosphaera sp.]